MIRIRIIGLNSCQPTPFDGKWLAEYDPRRPGTSPDGRPMIAHVRVVDTPSEALAFAEPRQAFEFYTQSHGLREDGKPNRPLTAFHVEFNNDLHGIRK